jgi:hypothetical protein
VGEIIYVSIMTELHVNTLPLTSVLVSMPWYAVFTDLRIKVLQRTETAMHAGRFNVAKAPSSPTRDKKWKEKQIVLYGRRWHFPIAVITRLPSSGM